MKPGDFVKIEYTGKVKETGEIFDTTDEALAKKNGIYSNKGKYGAVSVVVGAGYVLPGIDKKLHGIEAGKAAKFDVSPADAFGARDAKLIKLVPAEQFRKQGMAPVTGQYVRLSGSVSGKIISVSSGRVKIDFNHPLAGKVLEYEVKNTGLVEDTKTKVETVVNFYLDVFSRMAEVNVTGAKVEVSLPAEVLKFLAADTREKISGDIKKYVSGITDISFSEKKKPEKKELQAQKQESGAQVNT